MKPPARPGPSRLDRRPVLELFTAAEALVARIPGAGQRLVRGFDVGS